jgi:cell wall-associated protease
VANAIKYAVRNGARVINMSFGKDYTTGKAMVDDAIAYAASKEVLLVHAAGNESENNDIKWHYPVNIRTDSSARISPYWIEVAASGPKVGKELAGSFTNYGNSYVDVFAPGVNIFSLKPGNKFETSNGTSAACPVVTGEAALLMAYFPDLSAAQIKEIILSSAVKINHKVYLPDKEHPGKKKIRFRKLSSTGGIVNVYKAVQMALEMEKKKTG